MFQNCRLGGCLLGIAGFHCQGCLGWFPWPVFLLGAVSLAFGFLVHVPCFGVCPEGRCLIFVLGPAVLGSADLEMVIMMKIGHEHRADAF